MKNLAITLSLVLVGCGGDPFTAGQHLPDSDPAANGSGAVGSAPSDTTVQTPISNAGTTAVGSEAEGTGGTESAGQDSPLDEAPVAVGDAGGTPGVLASDAFDLIDDVEGQFPVLPERAGRNGAWFWVDDDSYGELTAGALELEPVRGSSHFAASISGYGFTGWGVQMGVSLRSPSASYDASPYCGVRFMAKGSGAGWSLMVSDRLSVPQGGECDPDNWESPQGCYRYVTKGFSVASAWEEVVIRFDDLRLASDPNDPRRLERTAIYDVLFNFWSDSGDAFELWVDDLSFIDASSSLCD